MIYNHTHSWQWALSQLLDGHQLHWKNWSDRTWIAFDRNGYLIRFSEVRGKVCRMSDFLFSREKATEPGWAIYEPPIEALRDEILFRQFSLNPSPDA